MGYVDELDELGDGFRELRGIASNLRYGLDHLGRIRVDRAERRSDVAYFDQRTDRSRYESDRIAVARGQLRASDVAATAVMPDYSGLGGRERKAAEESWKDRQRALEAREAQAHQVQGSHAAATVVDSPREQRQGRGFLGGIFKPRNQEPTYVFESALNASHIAWMQGALDALGLNAGPADGKYGPQTQAGVNAFRQAIGIAPSAEAVSAREMAVLQAAIDERGIDVSAHVAQQRSASTGTAAPQAAQQAAPATQPDQQAQALGQAIAGLNDGKAHNDQQFMQALQAFGKTNGVSFFDGQNIQQGAFLKGEQSRALKAAYEQFVQGDGKIDNAELQKMADVSRDGVETPQTPQVQSNAQQGLGS